MKAKRLVLVIALCAVIAVGFFSQAAAEISTTQDTAVRKTLQAAAYGCMTVAADYPGDFVMKMVMFGVCFF